ncbi:hypothetical protein A6M27_03005 [Acidithiobacillus thiooxidans]|uniref:Four helix bundle protein n=1 Tax=Acidithiobacillus thiooxidans TaxID=930 RepID=A0A1C2JM67_ACITH|nr:hypothetical protein [Acidithiobacillus thiooxidans]OCX72542.1 hypothetical protein A6O24_13875 [Acidithiobacillus thiooxidans]OCX76209.1 hypothetical protein A6P07_02640 [Acidithiobacillus thiooxidans]OCX84940.1 hypothetical protein A6O26_03045 [Acidithiobacillus thiooxidans]OCX89319.1 hypothetical protein A6M27_03005 [Acidithiobacillus thiooxidans]OFC40839.1 hypothetical protein BAE47_19270 [Acidithiobacillus thiooxidans]
MSDNVIPIVRQAHSRAVLRKYYFEINNQITHRIRRIQDVAQHDDCRFLGICDDLRDELSELTEICKDGTQQGFFLSKEETMESFRILTMMVSHMELMFLYSRKNSASTTHYRKEINATANEFLHRQARIAAIIV